MVAVQTEAGGNQAGSGSVTDTVADWNQMKSARQNWDVLWDSCARNVSPRKGNILTKFSPGQQNTLPIYDTTADKANKVFAAGVISSVTPAGEKWVRLQPKGQNAEAALKEWLDQATDILIDAIYTSNWYATWHEVLLDAGLFCTSCFLLEQGKNNLLNFIPIPVGTFAIAENAEGQVDKVGREWQWTARQAAQKWGRDKLGKTLQAALDDKSPSVAGRMFDFIHMVKPRENVELVDGFAAPDKRPWSSEYICLQDQDHFIEVGGYYEMPYFVNRLLRSNNEMYGRGPGVDTLPDIKMVNAMRRDFLITVEKMARPPWMMSDDSDYSPDNRPDGITYYTDPNKKPEQVQFKGELNWAKDEIEATRAVINDAFYVPMFQLFTNMEEQRREKTAYEVQQMAAEKLILFSPLFARLCNEQLNPALQRVFAMLARAGKLPPMPVDLVHGGEYEIVYTSKIALALKSAENQSVATVLQLIRDIFEFDPSVKNILKIPDTVRRVVRNVGLPADLVRSEREADALTAAENQAAEAAQQAQTAEMLSKSASNLGPGAQKLATEKLQQQAQQR